MTRSLLEDTAVGLARRGFTVNTFETEAEAVDFLLRDIPPEWSVGFGGSISVDQIGVYPRLASRGNPVYWHAQPSEEFSRGELLARAATADAYLASANAITRSGEILNTDGNGNRLSGLMFGHKRVYLVVGANKLTEDQNEAQIRIHNVAAPLNAKRLNRATPCRETGRCMNCDSPERICNATLILHRQPSGVPITVCLVNRPLGY